ncbi:uncharacterized protein LOC110982536 [Acanthaster planci]|uniref:Uncharacterized protein LOC110982536 n=1 Tax=Acanthaster planci TaxID=133434 RepID=A0A8B7YTT5_ACAPL|nr:uncharacterized protein LOC110982536 [Acanthaster planci]
MTAKSYPYNSHCGDIGIRAVDGIEYIEQDSIETPAAYQDNPTWGIDRIDSRKGIDGYYNYNSNVQGEGVNVYLLDSGIQTSHNVFGGRASLLFGRGDDSGHGTHCAGTAVGNTYGIARKALIHSVKICYSGKCALIDTLDGLNKVLTHAGKNGGVISRSLSGLSFSSPSLTDAMKKMWDNGFVISHAAGNANTFACYYTPQKMKEVIATGATNKNDKRAYFSNYGKCVDLFAPGVSIVSAEYSTSSNSGTTTMSGTSMACPHTSGVLALLMGKDKNATPQSLKDALLSSATSDVVSDTKGSPNRLLYANPVSMVF